MHKKKLAEKNSAQKNSRKNSAQNSSARKKWCTKKSIKKNNVEPPRKICEKKQYTKYICEIKIVHKTKLKKKNSAQNSSAKIKQCTKKSKKKK